MRLDKYGKLVHSIHGLVLTRVIPENPGAFVYLYDQPGESLHRQSWAKTVQVRFDMFAPFWTSNPIIMPFPMHPLQSGVTPAELEALRLKAAIEQQTRLWSVARLSAALTRIDDAAKAARLNGALDATLAENLLLALGPLVNQRNQLGR